MPTSKGEGREGNGKREGRGWEGGREKVRGGEEGKGKDDLQPTLFLGPAGKEKQRSYEEVCVKPARNVWCNIRA